MDIKWTGSEEEATRRGLVALAEPMRKERRTFWWVLVGGLAMTVAGGLGVSSEGLPTMNQVALPLGVMISLQCVWALIRSTAGLKKELRSAWAAAEGREERLSLVETCLRRDAGDLAIEVPWHALAPKERQDGHTAWAGPDGVSLSVPDRAFADAAEREAFVEEAERLRVAAGEA